MALVQKVSIESIQIAFGSLASSLMARVLRERLLDSSRINFISYKENSIKKQKKHVRGSAWSGSSEHNHPTAE